MFDLLQIVASRHPGVGLRVWIDDITQRVEGKKDVIIDTLASAAITLAGGFEELGPTRQLQLLQSSKLQKLSQKRYKTLASSVSPLRRPPTWELIEAPAAPSELVRLRGPTEGKRLLEGLQKLLRLLHFPSAAGQQGLQPPQVLSPRQRTM